MALVPPTSVGSGSGGGGATTISDTGFIGADQANFDLTGISGSFDHLRVFITGTTDRAGTSFDGIAMRLNNDSGTSYGYETSTSGRATGTSGIVGFLASQAGGAPANLTGFAVVTWPFYADTTKYKYWYCNGMVCFGTSGTNTGMEPGGGQFFSAAAITRITLFPASGTVFKAGSRCILYGITGSP